MRLDWKRFQDLIRVVVTKAGYRARPVMVGEAGVALISLSPWEQDAPEALLCCAPWDQPVVSGRLVAGFHQEMINRDFPRGTMFTPGYFRADAEEFKGDRPVELVSGTDFLGTLDRMNSTEREYLLKLTTAGDYDVPTCPACSVKMELRDSEMPEEKAKLKNLSIKKSETFVGDVRCNKLTIAKGVEVQFLKGVYANKMNVHGRAVGNFTVSGTADISNGAWLIGMVAARKVELNPGGVLDGEMKILNEKDIQPVRPHPKELLWGCPNYPKCPVFLHLRGREAPRVAA